MALELKPSVWITSDGFEFPRHMETDAANHEAAYQGRLELRKRFPAINLAQRTSTGHERDIWRRLGVCPYCGSDDAERDCNWRTCRVCEASYGQP